VSESQISVAGGDDNQIHNDEHDVVTPAVGPRFALEAGVPSKYFLLYGAEHKQNQTDGGELCENARNYSEPPPVFTHVPPASAGQIASDVG
jgi:hypothetical protein